MDQKTAFLRFYSVLFYDTEEDETTLEQLVEEVKEAFHPRQIDYLYHIGLSRRRYQSLRIMIDNRMSAAGRSSCLYRLFESKNSHHTPPEVLGLVSDMIRHGLYDVFEGDTPLFTMSVMWRNWDVVRMILGHGGLPAIWEGYHRLPGYLRHSLANSPEEDIGRFVADLEKCRVVCMAIHLPTASTKRWEKVGTPDILRMILPYMAPIIG